MNESSVTLRIIKEYRIEMNQAQPGSIDKLYVR